MGRTTRKADRKARITLPIDFADHLVTIDRINADEVRVRKVKVGHRRYSLEQLLDQVTDENRHDEIDIGRPSTGEEAG